jgi:hypothetical protein
MTNRHPWMNEQEPTVAVAPAGFMMCPVALQANWIGGVCPWQEVYAEARRQAERVVWPSPSERLYRWSAN